MIRVGMLWLALAGVAAADDGGCGQAISAENAQALYAAIKEGVGADGCKLEEVRTESDVLRVEWKKAGVSAPLVEIRPRACGEGTTANGPEFSLSAPVGTLAQCPDAVARLRAVILQERLGGAVRLGGPSGWKDRARLIGLIGGGAVLLLAVGWIVWRRRKSS